MQSTTDQYIEICFNRPHAGWEEVHDELAARTDNAAGAWRVSQFVPIAFAHVFYGELGVEFHVEYETINRGGQERHCLRFADCELYVAARTIAIALLEQGRSLTDVLPVVQHSAEHDTIRELSGANGDCLGIVLGRPMLLDYAE